MLADLHAITVPQDPKELTKNTREIAAALIACGIDPKKSIIFPQSAVSAHAELAWILSCYTPLGWLNRMTQFKEKMKLSDEALEVLGLGKSSLDKVLSPESGLDKALKQMDSLEKAKDKANLGLYGYPVLMASDILIYHATHVPVGEDQKQHLELARDIAGAFNRASGDEFFPLPEPLILGEATRVMSLNDGKRKMSKSEESDYSRINLTDDADAIAKKFRKAKSDSLPEITYDPQARPEAANLLTIYAALSDIKVSEAASRFSGKNFGALKNELADLAVAKLSPITARMRELTGDPAALDAILKEGAEKARAIAAPVLSGAMRRTGFIRL